MGSTSLRALVGAASPSWGAREALACWETAEALGWVEPLEPELARLFHQVIGTLVRLGELRS